MKIGRVDIAGAGVCLYVTVPESAPRGMRRSSERAATLALVRHAFGPDAKYAHTDAGAPYLDGIGTNISVSHCAGMCVLAVRARGPVGVDVENWREQLIRVSARFLTRREAERYGDDPRSLLKCWTAKEAAFKAAGDRSLVLGCFNVDIESGSVVVNAPRPIEFKVIFIDEWPRCVAVVIPV